MGRLIMWNVLTLDGYFEGDTPWDLSFHQAVWGPELERFSLEQLGSADALIFGRKTYEGMASYWQTAEGEGDVKAFMNGLPKFVFSRTLDSADWNNTTLINENAAAAIPRLKAAGARDLYVFGSSDLSESLLKAHLFDEIRLCLAPVVLGAGRPLFPKGLARQNWSLVSTRSLETGGVILKYRPA